MKFHSYIFLSSEPLKLSLKERKDFCRALASKKIIVFSYATLGLKVNTNILLWLQSDSLEDIQDLISNVLHTPLGRKLKIAHTLFGMSRPTQYSKKSDSQVETGRKGGKYLVIYPFTKSTDWYKLSFEKRKSLMWGHIQIGKKHPETEQLLLYSFGVDDSEFIVSYETDELLDFQTLVMELRSDKVRAYTLRDTPIFTCIYKPLEKVLDYL